MFDFRAPRVKASRVAKWRQWLDPEASHSLSHLATRFAYLSGLESQTCHKRPKLCPDTGSKLRSSGLAGEKTANYSITV